MTSFPTLLRSASTGAELNELLKRGRDVPGNFRCQVDEELDGAAGAGEATRVMASRLGDAVVAALGDREGPAPAAPNPRRR